jgi:ribonuclease HII
VLSIAAASIIAKVARDDAMHALHHLFPQYGFHRHAGYGTALHLAALRKHGASAQHRMSFRPVRDCYFLQ